VDHELPEDQGASVETHLEGCPRCQVRLRELEGVSAVLKAWDAQVPAGPPAAQRLERAVLARVEVASHQRLAERRSRRVTALALAAAVLVAVGAPLALGLARRAGEVPPEPFTRHVAAAPRVDPGLPPRPPQTVEMAADLLAHAPWALPTEQPAESSADEAAREAFLAGALAAQQDLERERAFTLRVGQRGVWVTDLGDGVPRRLLLTAEAARAFAPDELLAFIRAKNAEPFYDPPRVERPLGLTVGDLLGELLPDGAGERAWKDARHLYAVGRRGTPQHLLDLYRLAPRGAEAPEGPEVLDPLLAQQRGQLRLEPSPHDASMLNAIVMRTALPMLIPAGQLITGGETDLMVARATWLPAAANRDAWQIPCVSVRVGARRSEPTATLTAFVAGPGLRALLLAGAEGEVVRQHARDLWAGAGGQTPPEWSLLDLYDADADGERLKQQGQFANTSPHGVVVSDEQGRFQGLEQLNLRGEGAAPLLARLLHGYVWEATRRAFARGSPPSSVPAAGERPSLEAALESLRSGKESLVAQPAPAGVAAPGVSRATGTTPARAAESLFVDGRRVGVSVLPR
jgi:hypothetical protein